MESINLRLVENSTATLDKVESKDLFLKIRTRTVCSNFTTVLVRIFMSKTIPTKIQGWRVETKKTFFFDRPPTLMRFYDSRLPVL